MSTEINNNSVILLVINTAIFNNRKKVFITLKKMTSRARWGKTPQKPNEPDFASDEIAPKNDNTKNNGDPDQTKNDTDASKNNNNNQNSKPSAAAASSSPPPKAEEVLDSAIDVRKNTITATNRILRDLETVKNLELEALAMLHSDLEKVRRMDNTLVGIDESVSRSRMYIVAIGRKLYRDGCFKIMATLLICAIIVVIVILTMEGFDKIGGATAGNGGSSTTIVIRNGGDAETTGAPPTPAPSP